MGPTVRKTRAALAVASREASRHPDDPAHLRAVDQRRREHREASAEEYIRKLVEAAPPLTHEQRDKLALLLRGTP